MGERIKTALEKALERAESLAQVSNEKLLEIEYLPRGRALAGKYMTSTIDIPSELNSFPEDVRKYVVQGIEESLLQNILMPENENSMEIIRKALHGLSYIKEDKQGLDHITGELGYLFNYYQEAQEQVKGNVHAKLSHAFQSAKQQLASQYGGQIDFDIEQQPEFRREMLKAMGHVNQQFENALKQVKDKIKVLK